MRRLPEEDTLVALDGVVGAYPNAMFVVDPGRLTDVVASVSRLAGDADPVRLTVRFGVRRTDRRFWPVSDAVHAGRRSPADAAVLDYSRFEDR